MVNHIHLKISLRKHETSARDYRLDGWGYALPIYLFRCPEHGYQMSDPNGHCMLLICPMCRWGAERAVDSHVGMEALVEHPLTV